MVPGVFGRAPRTDRRRKGQARRVAARNRRGQLYYPAAQVTENLMNPPELRGVRILADMTNAQLQMLLTYGQVLPFAPGQIIVGQGNTAEALFLLLEGTVGAYVRDQHGNEVH